MPTKRNGGNLVSMTNLRTALAAAVLTIGVTAPVAASAPEGIRWNHLPVPTVSTVWRVGTLNCPAGRYVTVLARTYGPAKVEFAGMNGGYFTEQDRTADSWRWHTDTFYSGFQSATVRLTATEIDSFYPYCRWPW